MAERDNLLRAVQAARTGDQLAVAVAALDVHDRRRTASLQQSRETDLSATAVRATLEPLPAFERHTAATDWLGDVEIPSDYRTAMIAEASRWYRSIPRDLAADPDEFNEQALGHAYTAASPYGVHALAARREFMQFVSYLTRQGASGLPQIQQTEDPKDNPAPTPLPPETFDNFAPEQNAYNGGVETPDHASQISSEQAPMIQQLQQQDSSGSGFGSGPERPDEHSTSMDTADSYAEIPLGPPGTIPATPPGAAPSAPSTPAPGLGEDMDEGAERRQASLRVSAFTGPDQDGFRWRIGSDQDVDTFDAPYHERCGSLHWPEENCSHGQAHTASVAVGYLMNAEDFARRARFEAQGSAEGTAVLRAAGGDLKKLAKHHDTLAGSFRLAARTEDEIAWLHGYLARVRPVLAGGKDPFGGKAAPPFGADEPEDGGKKRKKKKGKGSPNFPEPRQGQLRKGAPFAGYKDFAACVAANKDKRNPEAYCGKIKHQVEGSRRTAQDDGGEQPRHYWDEYADQVSQGQQPPEPADYDRRHEGTRRTAGAKCACGEDADGICAACDKPVCDEHATMHDHDRFCPAHSGSHEGASQLPQVQQTVDSHDVPTPQADQLPQDVMFPLNPGWVSGEGGEDESKAKQAARSSMRPSNRALKMFGRMDAMEGKPPPHKDSYWAGVKGHGQYLRGHNETRAVIDATLGKNPVDKDAYAKQTGRPDLHSHYLGVYADVKAARDLDVTSRVPSERAFSNEPGGYQGSLRRQADTLTRPHETTDDDSPPYNTPQTTPQPQSSNEASGDYGQGVKDGQEDAAAGEHPTFSDNSSRVSPYVQGYSVGYSGRPADTGTGAVPASMGGDSGQAGNEADAQRAFQVSHASLQRQADYQRPYEQDSYDYVDPSVRSEIPKHIMHDLWRRDPDAGDVEPTDADYDRFHDYVRRTHGQGTYDAYFGHHEGMRRLAHDFTESERANAAHSLGPEHKLPVNSKQDLENAHRRAHQVKGESESAVDAYLTRMDKEFGKAASLRQVSAAFITREAVREPDFRKGYKYAARWQPGTRLVGQGSPAFEAGLYAGLADRPAVQEAWAGEHYRLSGRFPVLGARLDAHSSFTVKFARAHGNRYLISASGYLVPRRTAATSVDLITDGPGTSPDPMGSTPLNGPGQPPPMGGGEDPARSGGVPPYQGAPPPASAPVAPDDVLGQPQEPPQPSGSMTQTFSGRHPENVTLAPVAPNTAGGGGYSNTDAYQGDPQHKPQALAFRRKVQASLAARKVS